LRRAAKVSAVGQKMRKDIELLVADQLSSSTKVAINFYY